MSKSRLLIISLAGVVTLGVMTVAGLFAFKVVRAEIINVWYGRQGRTRYETRNGLVII